MIFPHFLRIQTVPPNPLNFTDSVRLREIGTPSSGVVSRVMAEEGGSEINGGLGQASMDSTESRWVFQDEDDSEIYDDDDDVSQRSVAAGGLDSEDEEDNAEQRLIRTGPRIDSFDVEALEVPGALRNDYEVASGVLVRCAFFAL
jgi:hypothetical protein